MWRDRAASRVCGHGPTPGPPAPDRSLIPTVNVVTAKGWSADGSPVAVEGTTVTAFARGLDHPRWLHVLPNGDVLVAETNAPPRPRTQRASRVGSSSAIRRRRAAPCPAQIASRCCATPTATASPKRARCFWRVSTRHSAWPCGNVLYVANSDALVRFPYAAGETQITAAATGGRPSCRTAQSSLDQEPHRECGRIQAVRRASAPTATSRSTASRRRRAAPRSGRSILKPAATASSRPGCAIPSGWPGSPRRTRCGSP